MRLTGTLTLKFNQPKTMSENGAIRLYPERPAAPEGLPLSGLTYAVKDVLEVSGAPLTFGLKPPLLERAESDAAIIKLLDSRGARLLGSTNLDPAAVSVKGTNPYYGEMKNPAGDYMLGGSSGGSAIAVASRWVDFALGSDHGGSVRIPAGATGLCGIILSSGSFDRGGAALLSDSLDTLGFIARKTAGLKFILQEILSPENQRELPTPEIIIPSAEELFVCSESHRQKFYALCKEAAKLSKLNEHQGPLGFEESLNARKKLLPTLLRDLLKSYNYPAESLPDEPRAILNYASQLSVEDIKAALRSRAEIKSRITKVLTENKLILTPLFPDDLEVLSPGAANINLFPALANTAECPALNFDLGIPCQLIGPPFSEISLLNFAENLQAVGKSGA